MAEFFSYSLFMKPVAMAMFGRKFDRLYDPIQPIRSRLETIDSVEKVRIIREALKKLEPPMNTDRHRCKTGKLSTQLCIRVQRRLSVVQIRILL